MKKILVLSFLLTFFMSCEKPNEGIEGVNSVPDLTTSISGNSGEVGGSDVDSGGETDPAPLDSVSSVPTQALTFNVNIKLVNFTNSQEEKMLKAVELIKGLVASEEFRSKVLNHKYNGIKTYVDNRGMTNAQIYQRILDGNESLQNTKDNEMDVEVELYYANNTTVGYTYANSKRIWANTKYFNTYSVASVAANLMHEWLHKLGFTHAVSYSVSRDYSVPYGVGGIVRSLGPSFY